MKKILLIGIWVCIIFHTIAQNIEVSDVKIKIGENISANKEIVGTEFLFSDRIWHSYIDTESNCITIQLRGLLLGGTLLKNNGDVLLYDLTNKKILWNKSINYQNYYFEQKGKYIFKTGLKKTFCLNFESGEETWKAKNNIAYINPKLKIGIGYTPYISNQILYNDINFEGIDLNTGNSIWKRAINHDYGLNSIFMINDTVAIIVSSGLHSVNLKNGKGWDYDATTGEPYFRAMRTDILSNVLIDSLDIYFASKENISRLNTDGRVIWSQPLPDNLTSSSNIILMDSTLFMINTGSCDLLNSRVKRGKPYLAAFDARMGGKLFLNTVDDKSGKINESAVGKNEILILYKDKIAKCSVLSGQLISKNSFDTKINGELIGFLGYSTFNKFDSTYKSLVLTDTLNHYVYTNKNKVLVINKDLDIINQYELDQLYKIYLIYNNLKFLTNKDKTIVVDSNNEIVAVINIAGRAQKIGSKLYFIKEKSIIEVDLDEITQLESKNILAHNS